MDVDAVLGGRYELIAPHLTERQRRLLAGAAARALGRGGGARMARISGLSRPTVYAGARGQLLVSTRPRPGAPAGRAGRRGTPSAAHDRTGDGYETSQVGRRRALTVGGARAEWAKWVMCATGPTAATRTTSTNGAPAGLS